MGRWVLAIDFGTTTTSAATRVAGEAPEVVEIGGSARMPSVVLATDSGELVVGDAAEAQLALSPERAERTPKRRLGDEVMLLGSRPVRPVEAVAAILRAMADEAIRRLGGSEPDELRLTHPARWGSLRRSALAEATAEAGLPEPLFVPEPVAAAVHFADERIVPGAFVAVYDLGGGTFDTAVLRRSSDGFDVVGLPGGDERLGGETFDDKLFAHVGERLASTEPEAWEALRFSTERSWRKAGHDLRMEVRRAKEALSANAEYTIYVGSPVDVTVVVTRDELEQLIRDDVARTVDELEATVSRSGLAMADLAAVNLVGGSSRIPLVTRMVAERVEQLPQTWGDPKAAVALGAVKATSLSSVTSARSDSDGGAAIGGRVAPLPESIGEHQVIAELGRGGMGVVYLARQPSLDRPVAVKTLPMLDPNLMDRLEREAKVLGELQHPHIATVIDVGSDERGTYVVMPFFAGGTAAHVVARDGRMAPGAAAGVLASVAEALAATHAKGFLHRDVKPSNILLSAHGDPYLGDFGLALPLLDSGRLTSSRAVLGTVPYTAPEILADEPATEASDAYALGVTGYQLLTGQLPYGGSNVLAVLDAVRRGEPTRIDELAPDVPDDLAALIQAAFATDPTERPTDLRAWASAVRATGTVEPVEPAPPVGWVAAIAAAENAAVPISAASSNSNSQPGTDAITGEFVATTETSDPTAQPDDGVLPAPARNGRRSPIRIRQRAMLAAAILVIVMLAGGSLMLFDGDPVPDPDPDPAEISASELIDVAGQTVAKATRALEDAGFEVDTEVLGADDAGDAAPGTVVRTTPGPGTTLEEGARVVLHVAPKEKAPEQKAVPDVIGMTTDEASKILAAAGFKVLTKQVETEAWDPGLAVGTHPRPGIEVAVGSEVELHYSVAPPQGDPGPDPNPNPNPNPDPNPDPDPIIVVDDCNDGRDNDGDGFTDGSDPDCKPGGSGDETNDDRPPPNQAPTARDQTDYLKDNDCSGGCAHWNVWLDPGRVTDPEGDSWQIHEHSHGNYGTISRVSCSQDPQHGCFRYVPSFSGSYWDAFWYTVKDSKGNVSKRGTISICVRC